MRTLTLDDGQRAELLQGLGRALSAGLDAARALDALAGTCDGAADRALARAASAVRNGTRLTLALDRQGLLGVHDRALLDAAEASGALDRVCERLAARHARTHARWRAMKGRLLLPAVILAAAVVLLPVPALAAGRLGVGAYLLRTGALLGLLALLWVLASTAVRHWRAHGTPRALTTAARLVPGIARLSWLHQRADACERIAIALACGLPAAGALDALRRVEPDPVRAAALARARAALDAGDGVADALERAALLDPPGYAIVSTGEGAGKLDASLQRVAQGFHDALDASYGVLAQMLPVALYLVVAGVVAWGLIG